MMRCFHLIAVLLMTLLVNGQISFKTLVPQEPIVVGESFNVEYVARETSELEVKTPEFPGFRLVHGPAYYQSILRDDISKVPVFQNANFTLEATRPGRFTIPGAIGMLDGKQFQSDPVQVVVISREEAAKRQQQNAGIQGDPSIFFLKPGEDPYKRIEKDLFVKVTVDRNVCFVGQPVVATFKLYSRLRSRSDIVKNPGFYGFSVHDMINLDDRKMVTELINGRSFDVHTIRQVQLYPLQEGEYTIESMALKNQVTFYRSAVDRKPEQEIHEGVTTYNSHSPIPPPGAEVFENEMATSAVKITVKPAPPANKPDDFNGATGNFFMTASLEKNTLAKNEEGHLVVVIRGSGNFNQLSPPAIQWPDGIEAFDPVITDSLDKKHAPLIGTKTFRFGFVSAKSGNYQLPALQFSYFDPVTNAYRQLSTAAQQLQVTQEEKTVTPVATAEKKTSIAEANRRVSLIAVGIICVAVLVVLGYWLTRKKEVKPIAPEPLKQYKTPAELLADASMLVPAGDNSFYRVLQRSTWDFFRQHFDFAGSNISKESLSAKLAEKEIDPALISRVMLALQQCETGIYTGIAQEESREILLQETKQALDEVHAHLLGQV